LTDFIVVKALDRAQSLVTAPVRRGLRLAVVLSGLVWATSGPATTTEATVAAPQRTVEHKAYTDAEIAEGFFKVTFGAEFHLAGRVDRIRKFEGPIRIFVDNQARPDRSKQVASVAADIRKRVRNLDLSVVHRRGQVHVVVTLVRDQDLGRTIRTLYGASRARRIQNSLEPQCLSGFRKDGQFRILHADVILVADVGDFIFLDCAYEELLQALGPINDDPTVPWSMFNDNVQMGYFGVFDQYILNILYDPRIRAGMSREQVEAMLPQVLPSVRAFVAETNNLPPY